MQTTISFICGVMMSIGLIISGMVNPQKVIGFLDIFGHFDPTLGFVMAGAWCVAILGYRWTVLCAKPVLSDSYDLPTKTNIDAPLIGGSIIFGIGWGLVGLCPAPAIVGIGLGLHKAIIFVAAMAIGMSLARKI